MIITVASDGRQVVSSTFWGSEMEGEGLFFLSPNAGCFRLLVPRGSEETVNEMKTGKMAVVSRGPWQGRDALELLFDDGTQEPFSMHLDARQCVPLPDESWGVAPVIFTVWTRPRRRPHARDKEGKPHCAMTLPCRVRWVESLPCLRPWEGPEDGVTVG